MTISCEACGRFIPHEAFFMLSKAGRNAKPYLYDQFDVKSCMYSCGRLKCDSIIEARCTFERKKRGLNWEHLSSDSKERYLLQQTTFV